MAPIRIRPVTEDEFPTWWRAIANGFGDHAADEDIEHARPGFELDRTVAAFDTGRIVGTAADYRLELTLPGLSTTPLAGVTTVTVAPTHRRRGVLTSMMRAQLDAVHERGDLVAGLYASESIIYGRFGYGRATEATATEIDTRYGAFRRPIDPGRLTLVDKDEAEKTFPDVHDRARRLQPGDVGRSQPYWDHYFRDREKDRHGASARFYVVHESAKGEIDGYAAYRRKGDWSNGVPNGKLMVHEVVSLNGDAEAALWRFLLDIDLVRTVETWGRPVDDPLRWLLADSRRLRTTVLTDQTWIRLVDVAGALAARTYSSEDSLVLEVNDEFCPWNTGRYQLTGSPDGAACKPAKKKADLAVEAVDLGATYLGGTRLSSLARAGRVEELSKGALRRADAMFATDPLPFCRTDY